MPDWSGSHSHSLYFTYGFAELTPPQLVPPDAHTPTHVSSTHSSLPMNILCNTPYIIASPADRAMAATTGARLPIQLTSHRPAVPVFEISPACQTDPSDRSWHSSLAPELSSGWSGCVTTLIGVIWTGLHAAIANPYQCGQGWHAEALPIVCTEGRQILAAPPPGHRPCC